MYLQQNKTFHTNRTEQNKEIITPELKTFSVVFCAHRYAHPRKIITDNYSSNEGQVE
jgi:hypothetical protein